MMGDSETDIDPVMAEMHTRELEAAGVCTNCGHTWACHEEGASESTLAPCPDPDDPMLHTCP